MKKRDVVLVATIVALAGLAATDAVRRGDGADGSRTRPARDQAADARAVRTPAPGASRVPRGLLPGSLLFTEARASSCRLRYVVLATGKERRVPSDTRGCLLWAPAEGRTIAKSTNDDLADGEVEFAFLDLAHPVGALRPHRAVFSHVVWSPDGRRAGWCAPGGGGFEQRFPGRLRRLERCPSAYTRRSRPAYARGRRLVTHERTVLRASGRIGLVSWARNGTVAVVVDGRRLERWSHGRRVGGVRLPSRPTDEAPILSPDNCAALLSAGDRVHLVDLGCFRGRRSYTNISPDNCLDRRSVVIADCARYPSPRTFAGSAAAWSPDGNWIAVAERRSLAFHRVTGRYDVVRWDVSATDLAWR